jgi:hypothetical protein
MTWITNKDAILTAFALRGFKKGDAFKCCHPFCSYSDHEHHFLKWDGGHMRISLEPGGQDRGSLELEHIAAWKPGKPDAL